PAAREPALVTCRAIDTRQFRAPTRSESARTSLPHATGSVRTFRYSLSSSAWSWLMWSPRIAGDGAVIPYRWSRCIENSQATQVAPYASHDATGADAVDRQRNVRFVGARVR